MDQKQTCQLCGGHIAYPSEMAGTKTNCPHCNTSITLGSLENPEFGTHPTSLNAKEDGTGIQVERSVVRNPKVWAIVVAVIALIVGVSAIVSRYGKTAQMAGESRMEKKSPKISAVSDGQTAVPEPIPQLPSKKSDGISMTIKYTNTSIRKPNPPPKKSIDASRSEAQAIEQGYMLVTSDILEHFPEKVLDKKTAMIGALYQGLSSSYIDNVPGVTLSSDGLQSTVNVNRKRELVGFWAIDSKRGFFHKFVGRKKDIGELLLSQPGNTTINIYGKGFELDRTGGAAGFWVERIEVVDK